jgi:hypothetical protein
VSRLSLRAAINAKCKSCIHDPHSGLGKWQEQVARCTVSRCPLHPVRVGASQEEPLEGPFPARSGREAASTMAQGDPPGNVPSRGGGKGRPNAPTQPDPRVGVPRADGAPEPAVPGSRP